MEETSKVVMESADELRTRNRELENEKGLLEDRALKAEAELGTVVAEKEASYCSCVCWREGRSVSYLEVSFLCCVCRPSCGPGCRGCSWADVAKTAAQVRAPPEA
jgi:hypothetical protein